MNLPLRKNDCTRAGALADACARRTVSIQITRSVNLVSSESFEAFRREFVSVHQLGIERGVHAKALQTQLKCKRITGVGKGGLWSDILSAERACRFVRLTYRAIGTI